MARKILQGARKTRACFLSCLSTAFAAIIGILGFNMTACSDDDSTPGVSSSSKNSAASSVNSTMSSMYGPSSASYSSVSASRSSVSTSSSSFGTISSMYGPSSAGYVPLDDSASAKKDVRD